MTSSNIKRAKLMYSVDDGTRPWMYIRKRRHNDAHKADFGGARELVTVDMHDGRRANEELTLDTSGFQLVPHRTSLSMEEFLDSESKKEIKSLYFDEISELIHKTTGAAYVHCFHHQVRNGSKNRDKQYATDVHSDTSPSDADAYFKNSIKEMEKKGVDVNAFKKGRYIYINAWRNISNTCPIQNNHLAMCDERSLSPFDYVPYDFHDEGYSGTHHFLSSRNASRHRWYYFPDMRKDEVILFKQFDSDPTRQARMCFHAAFHDPTAPQDAPPRQSIEVRCIAFFPNHSPNTCPSDDDLIRMYASSVILSVDEIYEWPKLEKAWFHSCIKKGKYEKVLDELIKDKDGDIPGLKKASPEIKSQVRDMALVQGFRYHCDIAHRKA